MKTGFGLILVGLLLTLPLWASFAMESHGTARTHACPVAPQTACPPSAGVLETLLFHAGHVRGLTLSILTLFVLFVFACAMFARREKRSLFSATCRNGQSFSASEPRSAPTRKFTRWLSLHEQSPSFA